MIYFSVYINFNEIIHLRKNLPGDCFFMFQTKEGPECYYGAVKEEAYDSFLEVMSAESLLQLEYLTEKDFRSLFSGGRGSEELTSFIGNRGLIDPIPPLM